MFFFGGGGCQRLVIFYGWQLEKRATLNRHKCECSVLKKAELRTMSNKHRLEQVVPISWLTLLFIFIFILMSRQTEASNSCGGVLLFLGCGGLGVGTRLSVNLLRLILSVEQRLTQEMCTHLWENNKHLSAYSGRSADLLALTLTRSYNPTAYFRLPGIKKEEKSLQYPLTYCCRPRRLVCHPGSSDHGSNG